MVDRARAFPWRVRLRDGVVEPINPVAFLDHNQWVSPVPTLRVERILADLPADAPTDLAGTPPSRLDAPGEPSPARSARARASSRATGACASSRSPTLLSIARLVADVPAEGRAALWRDAGRPEGATVAVAGGTLYLTANRWGSEYGFARPVMHVVGKWTGPGGEARYGEGTLDPRGTLG